MLFILFLVAVLLGVIFHIGGGLICLFRAAANEELDAHEKLKWMMVLFFIPMASFFYLMKREHLASVKYCGLLMGVAAFWIATELPQQLLGEEIVKPEAQINRDIDDFVSRNFVELPERTFCRTLPFVCEGKWR